ncbi:MAG: hypothetical protein E7463_12950 [Ruminococcaceae bacterium]|nr:hypothetical protein [Oscillospiraceae bacterium]
MDNIYYKPFLGKSAAYFPYTREQLKKRPIFPAYIFDTGAFLLCNDLFGTAENSDLLLEQIMSGELFKYWETDGEFDWYAVWNRFNKLNSNPEWEGHIWPARLYILLPVAQAYCRTHDKKYADAWYKIFDHWVEHNPYRTYPTEGKWFDMVWYEMQLAWRTINMVHSIYLLGTEDGDALEPEQWQKIYELILMQTDQMYREGTHYAAKGKSGNHQLQVGMALIMVGCLLPELGKSEEYIVLGRDIVSQNLLKTGPDGVNTENSMSYAHFIARLCMEAETMLTVNGYEGIPGCAESLHTQYEFLYQFASSDGRSQMIGDTYGLNAIADIEFVNEVFPLRFERRKKSCLFPDGRMAVLRNENFELFVDAMDPYPNARNLSPEQASWGGGYGYHQHYGRPHFILYGHGQQLVMDLGTVNYDRCGLRSQLNRASSHNVVSCREIPLEHDLTATKVVEKLTVTDCSLEGPVQTLSIRNETTDPETGKSFVWDRIFRLSVDNLEIIDGVRASEPMHFDMSLHLPYAIDGYVDYWAANQPVSRDGCTMTLRRRDRLQKVVMDSPAVRSICPCVNARNRLDCCEQIMRSRYTDHFTERTVITFD